MGKTGENPSMAADKSQKQERGDRWSKERRQNRTLCIVNGPLSSWEFGAGTSVSKVQRQGRTPRRYYKRRFWFVCSVHWTRIISISNDSSKSHGHYIKASRMFRTSSWCSIRLYSGHNGRCLNIIKKFQSQNVQILDTSTEAQMA